MKLIVNSMSIIAFLFISTNVFAVPSQYLLDVLKGNVFVQHQAFSPSAIKKLHQNILLRLHPDKLGDEDREFLDNNAVTLRLIHADLATESIYSLPMLLLQRQQSLYQAMIDNLPGKSNYCDLCDQVVEHEFIRVSQGKNSTDYTYFHNKCLEYNGLKTAKSAYLNGDLDQFSKLANSMQGKDHKEAWLFFIENELKNKRYRNVFNNLFSLLPDLTDGNSNREYLKKIAHMLFDQGMDISTYIQYLKVRSAETTSMEYLSRPFIIKHMMASPDKIFQIVDQFSKEFQFAKEYFGLQFLSDIINMEKSETEKFKDLIKPLIQKLLLSESDIKDFFTYYGYFSTFLKDFPNEAQAILPKYRGRISEQRYGICEQMIRDSFVAKK